MTDTTLPTSATIASILDFWFTETTPKQHFIKDEAFDSLIGERFSTLVERALAGALQHWADTPQGTLACILLLDQFTRNIYRNTPMTYAGDERALALSLKALERGDLDQLSEQQCAFLLMPMMHSEDLSVQEDSLALFKRYTNEQTYHFAVQHRDIIAQFGRFPHRNAILGRDSSAREQHFLTQSGSSF